MKKHSRFEVARKILIFWCLFIGVGAAAGATGMLAAPDGSALGMQALLPCFQALPFAEALFQDFVFPGIALLCVNGIPNLIAAYLLIRRKRSGIVAGGIFGVTLMLWISIQFVIFERNFMSISYFIFGALQAATGYAAWVFFRQEHFVFRAEDYKNVGANPRELVVYFSRMGYVRKLAYEAADKTGAEVYEIRAAEPTEGTAGFWWCGRYGLHGWDMPIEKCDLDLTKYDRVTICAPVWVFQPAAPVKSFCRAAKGKIKRADYILAHHMRCGFSSVMDGMDALLGLRRESGKSVRCRVGKFD